MTFKLSPWCKDITGNRYGRLIAVEPVGLNKNRQVDWLCTCDCGNTKVITGKSLSSGNTKSCGCLWQESISAAALKANTTHGMRCLPEYTIWKNMRNRCNSNTPNYSDRGITVCSRWDSFQNFIEDMGRKPSDSHSIDRIDNDGNYSPNNCRWATAQEQQRNKRTNRTITFDGKTLCLAEWEEICGINQRTLKYRLNAGWSDEDTICKPLQH